jgi:hypothetical protein
VTQDALFTDQPLAPMRALTARQAAIFQLICESPQGLTAPELGQLLHAQSRRHHADDVCEWCGQDGQRALREKAIRQRVIRRATGIYEPRIASDWTGRATLGKPSAQLRELAGTTWEDAFHPKGEAA